MLQGAILAARNARRFVEDSVVLLHDNRFGSASITAVIAIENVGRARRILQQILEGKIDPATGQFGVKPEIERAKFLKNIRTDHATTIRAGLSSLQFSVTSKIDMTEFNKLIQALQNSAPGTAGRAAVTKKLRRAGGKVFNKATTGFHFTRTIEQYVEPDDKCATWNEPNQVKEEQVRELIVNAITNYNLFVAEMTANKQLVSLMQEGVVDDLKPLPTELAHKKPAEAGGPQ